MSIIEDLATDPNKTPNAVLDMVIFSVKLLISQLEELNSDESRVLLETNELILSNLELLRDESNADIEPVIKLSTADFTRAALHVLAKASAKKG